MAKNDKDQDEAAAPNLRLWRTLGKTDPRETKPITGGRFKGTAIKPMWINKRLTETFGPCGIGWGMDRPEFQVITADDHILVYCIAKVWYVEKDGGAQHFAFGVGGDKVRTKERNGYFYDDEAFKKAYTDALGNAWKFIGVAADIHMGMFDDSKYVQDLKQEFINADDTLGSRVDLLLEAIRTAADGPALNALKQERDSLRDELGGAKRDGEIQMVTSTWNARVARLREIAEADSADGGEG